LPRHPHGDGNKVAVRRLPHGEHLTDGRAPDRAGRARAGRVELAEQHHLRADVPVRRVCADSAPKRLRATSNTSTNARIRFFTGLSRAGASVPAARQRPEGPCPGRTRRNSCGPLRLSPPSLAESMPSQAALLSRTES
jgi:hypothetical protein